MTTSSLSHCRNLHRLLAIAFGLPLLLGLLAGCTTSPQPRVDQLAAQYHANRAFFDQVAQLASIDATFGIDVESGSIAGDIAPVQLLESLAALDRIGARHLSAADHELEMVVGSEGLGVSGVQWGYYYTTSSEIETITLEAARRDDAPSLWFYPLGDGWYASLYRF